MGQKTSPVANRLTITRHWLSQWFADRPSLYRTNLIEDLKIRRFIMQNYGGLAGIARVEIHRTPADIKIDIFSSKPGILIGRGGTMIAELRQRLKTIFNRDYQINIIEVQKPELSAQLIAQQLGQQISKRMAYRRAMRQATEKVMQAGALGVRISIAGRLGGREMARTEKLTTGLMPTSTFRKLVDFAVVHAPTAAGIIGIKVWVHRSGQNQGERPTKTGR